MSPVQQVLRRVVDEYRALVDDLASGLTEFNVTRARAENRKLVGELQVNATEHEIRIEAQESAFDATLLRAAGGNQVLMVAGPGFGNYLHAQSRAICLLKLRRD